MRPVGETLLEMEPLLFELALDQDLQKGEILALISTWIDIHCDNITEKYLDGSSPIYYYGNRSNLIKLAKGLTCIQKKSNSTNTKLKSNTISPQTKRKRS